MGKEDDGMTFEPSEDEITTSKRLQDQLRRGLVYSRRRTKDDHINPSEPGCIVRDILTYTDAFFSSSSALSDYAERSANGRSVAIDYAWFVYTFDRFEDVPHVEKLPDIDWKVRLNAEAENTQFKQGLYARFRQNRRGIEGNNRRRSDIAKYYLEIAGGIYGDPSKVGYIAPTYEDLIVADFLHRRAQDLLLTTASVKYLKNCDEFGMDPKTGKGVDPILASSLKNSLFVEQNRVDHLLARKAAESWGGCIDRGLDNDDEDFVAKSLERHYQNIFYTLVQEFH